MGGGVSEIKFQPAFAAWQPDQLAALVVQSPPLSLLFVFATPTAETIMAQKIFIIEKTNCKDNIFLVSYPFFVRALSFALPKAKNQRHTPYCVVCRLNGFVAFLYKHSIRLF